MHSNVTHVTHHIHTHKHTHTQTHTLREREREKERVTLKYLVVPEELEAEPVEEDGDDKDDES